MHAWVYILECADGSFYTGSTKDLQIDSLNIKMDKVPIIRAKGYW